VFADERLDRRRTVHVGDRDDQLIGTSLLKLLPAVQRLIEIGHIRHRASGAQVGKNDAHLRAREDVRALSHEMHAAEDDKLGVLLVSGFPGELEAVSGEIRVVDDGVLLIMVAEDDQPLT